MQPGLKVDDVTRTLKTTVLEETKMITQGDLFLFFMLYCNNSTGKRNTENITLVIDSLLQSHLIMLSSASLLIFICWSYQLLLRLFHPLRKQWCPHIPGILSLFDWILHFPPGWARCYFMPPWPLECSPTLILVKLHNKTLPLDLEPNRVPCNPIT